MPDETNPDIPKIRFSSPAIGENEGGESPEPEPTPVTPAPTKSGSKVVGSSKIRTFGKRVPHDENWNRAPNITGNGATHCRTFHSKMTDESLRYMDQVINEWLDAHPEYEVKFVTSTIGMFTGKTKEPALICQVWV